jgi:hypothetical protein
MDREQSLNAFNSCLAGGVAAEAPTSLRIFETSPSFFRIEKLARPLHL